MFLFKGIHVLTLFKLCLTSATDIENLFLRCVNFWSFKV